MLQRVYSAMSNIAIYMFERASVSIINQADCLLSTTFHHLKWPPVCICCWTQPIKSKQSFKNILHPAQTYFFATGNIFRIVAPKKSIAE